MKVFLSSTAQDLDAYRKVADDTILSLSQESIVMERFGAKPGTPVDECEQLASQSDVVVCIVAHRYGFIPEKRKGSITRREVEAAYKTRKDVLVWIVDDSFSWTEKKEQDLLADPNVINDPARVEEVREGVAGLIEFKAWLRRTFTPQTFTTPNDLGRKIAITLGAYVRGHAATSLPQDRISISRLPTSGAELFGRESELQLLDEAWENEKTNIVSFVAWGGVGKTALVNHWLKKRMARDNYRGADCVYGWSFFSQGTSERAASADLFIDQALRWFGDTDPTAGSPWDKGERLANYLRQSRTLLVLDGLEPLQHPPGPQEGKLKDAAMQALLVELAAQQPGLCVVSTREQIGDLIEFENGTVIQHNLEQLSPQAGAQILRSLNVKGDDAELEQASREFGGHAFSLTLLGSYLEEVLEGDIQRRKEIQNLFEDTRYGEKAQAMIAAYEKWLGEGLELGILRLLGLFDRPADAASIAALREPPAISGLTEPLHQFKGREWNQALSKLRRIKLLAAASTNEPATVDAHPLLREHFKQQLQREKVEAWHAANNRLYEHLKSATKTFPETMEEMAPLFAAIGHGCAAGRHQEALDEVYRGRIQRGSRSFNTMRLGAIGAELAALTGFFEVAWQQPVATLDQNSKGFVLNETGMDLRALGRLREAEHLLRAGLQERIAIRNWTSATVIASNLSQLYLLAGNLTDALKHAQQSVELADRSNDAYQRMSKRTTLADSLHQLGETDKAIAAFQHAEDIQAQLEPDHPLLHSLWGFRYCDLLLEQGHLQLVSERASASLELEKRKEQPTLLAIALDNLMLGRVGTLEIKHSGKDANSQTASFLQSGLDGLREAGRQDYLPRGLLARAEFHRFSRVYKRAERDLAETARIATRSGMNLYLADYHLESARLWLAQVDKSKAREHWTTAKKMIDDMGYHRRDKEVEEIGKQLGETGQ